MVRFAKRMHFRSEVQSHISLDNGNIYSNCMLMSNFKTVCQLLKYLFKKNLPKMF